MTDLVKLMRNANPTRLSIYLIALWKLFKHPQTPRAVKWLAIAVLAYAVSPIDLIPDFIPVLGLLDDLILVPMGVALVVLFTPKPVWAACVREAEATHEKLPKLRWGALIVVLLWLVVIGLITWGVVSLLSAAA